MVARLVLTTKQLGLKMQHYKKILGRCYNCEKSGHLTQDYKKRIDKDLKQN
jgi:hypothetical protein